MVVGAVDWEKAVGLVDTETAATAIANLKIGRKYAYRHFDILANPFLEAVVPHRLFLTLRWPFQTRVPKKFVKVILIDLAILPTSFPTKAPQSLKPEFSERRLR